MQDLQRIEEEHYRLREGEQLQDYVTLMLQFIGDPQPELRDELIYPTFYEWITEKNRFNETELRSLLIVLTDEQHLFYHIGREGDPSVFTRTFSILPIVLIVRRHRQQPFLDLDDFQHLKNSLLRYYNEEKDLRGYVSEGGWAHSAAHGADALVELVQCPESDETLQLEVLGAVKGMLHNGIQIFNEEDDERIVSIVDSMIDKDLIPKKVVEEWISGLTQCTDWPRSRSQVIARVNSKNFVRSLYFRRRQDSQVNGFVESLLAAEAKLNKFAISKF
jgi:hypothetical protein